jgi:hypothetical protein
VRTIFTLFFLQVCLLPSTFTQVITIGTTGDYPNLEAAENFITPGDTLLLQAQTFADGTQFLENVNGTAAAPIIIVAETEHQSVFQGGTEAIHLINCSHIEINGLVVEQQTGNGINIDDGGDYATPSKHITVRNCIFRDMGSNGNNDFLKMSGVDSFLIESCQFINGANGGSGVDFVGCHWGVVQDCHFEDLGASGIQNKGGTQFISIQRNVFKNIAQRALNLGGSTGLQFFRPPLGNPIVDAFEAADLEVFANIFIGNWSPIAYVGSVRVKVYNNTFYQPENWVVRILQETTTPGFLTCSENEFINNIVYLPEDITEVNTGPNTAPETFVFSHNLWYNADDDNWSPVLPVTDTNQLIGDPLFEDPANENFRIPTASPAVGSGLPLAEPATDFDQAPFQTPPSRGAFEGGEIINTTIDQSKTPLIQVYPNPASDELVIEADFPTAEVHLINSLGEMIQSFSEVGFPLTVDVSQLVSGVYFVVVTGEVDQQIGTAKIIKH